ncbi:MAG: hypothetical protein LBG43_00630 [Treponema sp.]|jgi:hypothetical protein|nr:hypothetical protein [Treponema sp.]
MFAKTQKSAGIVYRERDVSLGIVPSLESGDKVIIIEIMSKPSVQNITYHIERMDKLRGQADLHNDKRVYPRSIGGAVFNENEKIYALKKDFYALEPSGKTLKIITPEGKRRLREWQPAFRGNRRRRETRNPPPTCLQKSNQQRHRNRQAARDCPQNAP